MTHNFKPGHQVALVRDIDADVLNNSFGFTIPEGTTGEVTATALSESKRDGVRVRFPSIDDKAFTIHHGHLTHVHKHGPVRVDIKIAFTDGARSVPGRRDAPTDFRTQVIERGADETQEAFATRVHDVLAPWGSADKLLGSAERVAQFHVGRTVTALDDITRDWRGGMFSKRETVPKGKRGIVTDVGPNHVCVDFETHFQNLRVNPDDIKPTDTIIDDPVVPPHDFKAGQTVFALDDIFRDWRNKPIPTVPKGTRGRVTLIGRSNDICVLWSDTAEYGEYRHMPDALGPEPEVYRVGQAVRARRLLDHLDSAGTLAVPLPKHTRGNIEHVHDDGILVAFRKPGADGNVLRYRVDPDDIEPIKMMQDAPTFRVNQAVRAAKDILHNAWGEEMIHHIDKGWHGSVVHIAPKFIRVDWAARGLGLLDILPEDIEPLPNVMDAPTPSPPPETYLRDHPPTLCHRADHKPGSDVTPKALTTYAEGDAIFLQTDVSHDYEGQPIPISPPGGSLRAGTSGFIEQVALEGPAAPRIGVKLPSVHPHHVFQLNPVCIGRMEPPRGQSAPEEEAPTYAFKPGDKVLAQGRLVCDADANPLPHPVEKSNRGVVREISVVDGKLQLVRVGWLGATSRRMYWHEPGDLRLEPVLGPKEDTSVTRLDVPRDLPPGVVEHEKPHAPPGVELSFTEHLRGMMSAGLRPGLAAAPARRNPSGRIVPSMAETEALISFALQAMTGARIKVDTFEHGGLNALMVAGEVPALTDHIDQLAHRLESLNGELARWRAIVEASMGAYAKAAADTCARLQAMFGPAPWAEGDKVIAREAIIHDIEGRKLRSAIPKEHPGAVARIDDDQRALVVTFDPLMKDGASLYVKVPVAWVRRA